MPSTQTGAAGDAVMLFVGLAPFLRMNIAGDDLRPVGQQLLQLAQRLRTTPICGSTCRWRSSASSSARRCCR